MRYLRFICILSAAAIFAGLNPTALASGRMGDLHEYCAEAEAIVIGSTQSYSEKDPSATFKVERWIKSPPASTQAASQPAMLKLVGGEGHFTGQTFSLLKGSRRSLVFVFAGGRTGDGRLGSIVPIDEKGNLPVSLHMRCLEPQPKTLDELLGQITRVQSKVYRAELIARLQDQAQPDPERARAATRLGALKAADAWKELEAQATEPGRDEESAKARESLLALFRIDETKTTPLCLRLVKESRHDYQVSTAAWLLMRRPSTDAGAIDVLIAAAERWEKEARYPDDHPLPELMQAITILGKRTAAVEGLIQRGLEKGAGNRLITAMYGAQLLNMREMVPRIVENLRSPEKVVDIRGSAAIALVGFGGDEARALLVRKPVSEEQARQAAADAFPRRKQALLKAESVECGIWGRVVYLRAGGDLYVLVGWRQEADQTEPRCRAIRLYDAATAAK